VLFLVVLFLLKNGLLFKNTVDFIQGNQASGLAYDANITVGDLVNKDTDGDGVPDWEETLYGLDPTKRETTPGIPDSTAIAKMKVVQGNEQGLPSLNGATGTQNLTQTDKFSRELFSTVAALNQNGNVDQATVDQIGNSLADNIKNSPQRKIYTLADIKVTQDNSLKAVKNYNDTLNNIYKKYPSKGNVMDIMQRFIVDTNNVDSSVLTELDPIITQMQNIVSEIVKINTPSDLTQAHLGFINAIERLLENLNDIKLYDSDVIVALGGISQYETNSTLFLSSLKSLQDVISQKLGN
jgi:hypothetical protein